MKLIAGAAGKDGAEGCIMQWAIWRLTNHRVWDDRHPCFNALVTFIAQAVNDHCTDTEREILGRDFLPRLERCRTAADPDIEILINRDLALFILRRLEKPGRLEGCAEAYERALRGEITFDHERNSLISNRSFRSFQNGTFLSLQNIEAGRPRSFATSVAMLLNNNDDGLHILDGLIETWEKAAANHGGLGNPLPVT